MRPTAPVDLESRPPRLLTAVLAMLMAALAGAALGAGAPSAEPGQGADDLIVRFTQGYGEMAGSSQAVLEVWGDGRVVVTRPAFVAGRPHVVARVPRSEVARLLTRLAERGIFELDGAAMRAELKAARRARAAEAMARPGEVTIASASDPDPTTLEVRAATYIPAGPDRAPQHDVTRTIDWRGLRQDAAQHPELPALAALDAAQDDLRAFMARADLR